MVEPPLGGVASAVLDAEMTMGDSSSVSCAALNSAYTGTATLSCSDHYSRGKPVIDVSGCGASQHTARPPPPQKRPPGTQNQQNSLGV